MADTDRLAKEIAGILRSSGSRQTKAYDTPAVVRRVDGSTAWVHIPGGVDETPVQLTVAASAGDTVQVRVSGGTAWIVGNASAPPTDDKVARAAQETADVAVTEAEEASEMSTEAQQVARAAAKIAGDTKQHFWFTETGTDTGAHITEKTQEDFLADPDNGGGNLLARSNGIAVRDGMVELAQFSADAISLNTNNAKVFEVATSGSTATTWLEAGFWGEDIYKGNTKTYSVNLPHITTGAIEATISTIGMVGGGEELALTYGTSMTSVITSDPNGTITFSYDGDAVIEVEFDATLGKMEFAAVQVWYHAILDAPYYTIGTRRGGAGAFSATIGEGLYATQDNQVAIGKNNLEDLNHDYVFMVGNGAADNIRTNIYTLGKYGNPRFMCHPLSPSPDPEILAALSTLGWGSVVSSDMLDVKALLEKLLGRLSLFDQSLSMSVASWTTGNCTVTGSSKYRVFEVVQGGASCIAIRYGNDVRGFAISGNASSGNYNQYIRAFGASVNWSTEVWTMSWAKQLSHVTTSSYHTSGAEQAITEIRGLIPLQNA